MASSALYCINIQKNASDAKSTEVSAISKNEKQMHGNNSKIIRTITTSALNENQTTSSGAELNSRNNFILVRNSKGTDGGHFLLRTDELAHSKNNILLEDTEGGKIGQILIQQSEIKKGVLVQSVKRLNSPIFLLSGGDNSNGNILIHTAAPTEEIRHPTIEIDDGGDNILVQALEGIHDGDSPSSRGLSTPIDSDGEPIKLPENLESLPRSDHFPTQRHRWNMNEEIAAILISFDRHSEWQSKEVKIRPKSGSILLYSRKKVRYRRDGYCWKKRKDGKTTREDHMKLKVQGTECIYGCYVHSAILPTFHRRCYWLLQNPDIVLVHYLNVPYPDDNKLAVITPSLALWADKKEWTKEELVSQLKPMFFSEDEPDINNELEISTAETVEAIVSQLMEKQRVARQAALVKQLECGCPDSTCADGKSCSHPMRRITAAKEVASSPLPSSSSNSIPPSNSDNNNQVSSTTGSGPMLLGNGNSPRVYSRDTRNQQTAQNNINCSSSSGNTPPLVLSLSQIQGGGGLLILNSNSGNSSTNHQNLVNPVSVANFVCNTNRVIPKEKPSHLVLKQEVMETNPSSCLHSSKQNSKSVQRDMKMELSENHRQSVFHDNSMYNNRKTYFFRNHHQQTEVIMSSAPSTPSKHMDTSQEDVVDDYKHQNFCNE